MAHVINEACIDCRYTSCVDVCPVKDCFKIGPNMLVIDPGLCIDCGLCVQVCDANAITHDSIAELYWVGKNAELSKIWEPINRSISPLPSADEMKDVKNKRNLLKI